MGITNRIKDSLKSPYAAPLTRAAEYMGRASKRPPLKFWNNVKYGWKVDGFYGAMKASTDSLPIIGGAAAWAAGIGGGMLGFALAVPVLGTLGIPLLMAHTAAPLLVPAAGAVVGFLAGMHAGPFLLAGALNATLGAASYAVAGAMGFVEGCVVAAGHGLKQLFGNKGNKNDIGLRDADGPGGLLNADNKPGVAKVDGPAPGAENKGPRANDNISPQANDVIQMMHGMRPEERNNMLDELSKAFRKDFGNSAPRATAAEAAPQAPAQAAKPPRNG